MDEQGIWAQIVYPNTVGLRRPEVRRRIDDETLRRLSVELYNDAMAEIQDRSGGRLFPMGIVPWWDVDLAVARDRAHRARSACAGSTPRPRRTTTACPTSATAHWNPMWEACAGARPADQLPHRRQRARRCRGSARCRGRRSTATRSSASGSAMMYLNNARVIGNLIYSGVLERYPDAAVRVGGERRRLDPVLARGARLPGGRDDAAGRWTTCRWRRREYFRRQIYACFWFERTGIADSDRERRRRPHDVRDRLPAPHVPLPRRPRLRRRRAGGRRRRHHRRDHGAQRGPPLPHPAARATPA